MRISIIEVLIVIAIVSILAAILVPFANTVGRPFEVVSTPYVDSYQECVDTTTYIKIDPEDGSLDTEEVCVRYAPVYQLRQQVEYDGRWWKARTYRVLKDRVPPDYQYVVDTTLEKK